MIALYFLVIFRLRSKTASLIISPIILSVKISLPHTLSSRLFVMMVKSAPPKSPSGKVISVFRRRYLLGGVANGNSGLPRQPVNNSANNRINKNLFILTPLIMYYEFIKSEAVLGDDIGKMLKHF